AVAALPSGKILLAGTAFSATTQTDFALVRLDSGGFQDPSFGTGGRVAIDFHGQFDLGNALALQPNGEAIVAGSAFSPTVGTEIFALVRSQGDTPASPTLTSLSPSTVVA